jgi:hypothetical protein
MISGLVELAFAYLGIIGSYRFGSSRVSGFYGTIKGIIWLRHLNFRFKEGMNV